MTACRADTKVKIKIGIKKSCILIRTHIQYNSQDSRCSDVHKIDMKDVDIWDPALIFMELIPKVPPGCESVSFGASSFG